jgi:hypothetical protein
MIESDGLNALYGFFHGVAGRLGRDQEHLPSGRAMFLQIGKRPVVVAVLIRINAVQLALAESLANALRRIPFAHELVKQRIEMGVAVELVAANQQAADLVAAETDPWEAARCGRL